MRNPPPKRWVGCERSGRLSGAELAAGTLEVLEVTIFTACLIALFLHLDWDTESFLVSAALVTTFAQAALYWLMPRAIHDGLIPVLAGGHVIFWATSFVHCLCCDSPLETARQVHRRLHGTVFAFDAAWVTLAFFGGFTPGSARVKLALFGCATLFIVGRLWVLAHALGSAVEVGGMTGLSLLQAVLHKIWVDPTPLSVELQTAAELVEHGLRSLVLIPLVGLSLGLLARQKWEDARATLDERSTTHQAELAELRALTTQLETARREALVRQESVRRTRSGSSGSRRGGGGGGGGGAAARRGEGGKKFTPGLLSFPEEEDKASVTSVMDEEEER